MSRELLKEASEMLSNIESELPNYFLWEVYELVTRIELELAKLDPEPVAWIDKVNFEMLPDKDWLLKCYVQNVPGDKTDIPLYTVPPEPNRNNCTLVPTDQPKEMQRKLKPLSNTEISKYFFHPIQNIGTAIAFARAIEAAHGITK